MLRVREQTSCSLTHVILMPRALVTWRQHPCINRVATFHSHSPSLAHWRHHTVQCQPRRKAKPISAMEPPLCWFFTHHVRRGHFTDTFRDVEDWLDCLYCAALFNRWDERCELHNVHCSREDSARPWIENDEYSLTCWQEFRRELLSSTEREGRTCCPV